MPALSTLENQDLQNIQGGFPWAAALTVAEIIRQEMPDFIRGWRDYPTGRFSPPN